VQIVDAVRVLTGEGKQSVDTGCNIAGIYEIDD
jgi:hypothetical protein